jgi:type I restriction enzyme S subunit
MNAEQLLQHFERISEAPDAIPRLRRFILDLAVRGKLVEQDPIDELASELLKRIAEEKARLVKASKIKAKPSLAEVTDDQAPYKLPSSWQWVRFANIVDFSAGRTPSRNEPRFWNSGDYYWVSIADMREGQVLTATKETVSREARESVFRSEPEEPGTIIMSFKLTIGKIARLGVTAFHNEAIISIRPHIGDLDAYLFKVLPQFARQGDTKGAIKGATLNRESISNIFFPLPPLAEQHRIVAKVDELMNLCDQLEAAKAEREKCRDRLVAASLQGLSQPAEEEETFREHARFTFKNLPRITTRAVHIKQLRQTILNLAVRGKLVPQDPSDEPAAELLKRIGAEKARLVKAGKIKREKPLPPLSQSDKAFEVPSGWEWVRLGDLTMLVTSGSRDWAKHYSNDGAIFVRMGNLSKDHYRLRLDHVQRVKAPADGEGTRTRLEPGDILISITGEVGMLGLIPDGFGEAYINQHTAMVRPVAAMKGRYLAELFRSQFAQAQFNEPQRGIKNSFRLTDVTQFVLPLPPLAEQHRIVAKVDELMVICDQLEEQITATEQDSRCFLESVLADALAPGIDLRAEAKVA